VRSVCRPVLLSCVDSCHEMKRNISSKARFRQLDWQSDKTGLYCFGVGDDGVVRNLPDSSSMLTLAVEIICACVLNHERKLTNEYILM